MATRTLGMACLLFGLGLGCGGDDGSTSIYGSSYSSNSGEGTDPSSAEGSSTDVGDGDPGTTSGATGDGDSDSSSETTADESDTDQLCGNGIIDGGEQCDGANLGGMTCASLGFTGGTLACDPSICVYDTSACTNDQGNQCDQFCNGCTCPSNECTMCCALKGMVDVCTGGMCGCF